MQGEKPSTTARKADDCPRKAQPAGFLISRRRGHNGYRLRSTGECCD